MPPKWRHRRPQPPVLQQRLADSYPWPETARETSGVSFRNYSKTWNKENTLRKITQGEKKEASFCCITASPHQALSVPRRNFPMKKSSLHQDMGCWRVTSFSKLARTHKGSASVSPDPDQQTWDSWEQGNKQELLIAAMTRAVTVHSDQLWRQTQQCSQTAVITAVTDPLQVSPVLSHRDLNFLTLASSVPPFPSLTSSWSPGTASRAGSGFYSCSSARCPHIWHPQLRMHSEIAFPAGQLDSTSLTSVTCLCCGAYT